MTVTDGKDTISHSLGTIVIGAAPPPALEMVASDPYPTTASPQQILTPGRYSVYGGTPPYRFELVDEPAGIGLTRINSGVVDVDVLLRTAGSFPGGTLRVTDAAGVVKNHPLPTFNIVQEQETIPELEFEDTDDLPEVIEAGGDYEVIFKVKAPIELTTTNYYLEIVGETPHGIRIIDVDCVNGIWKVYGSPRSFGLFANLRVRAVLRVTVNGVETLRAVEYRMRPFTATPANMPAIQLAGQFQDVSVTAGSTMNMEIGTTGGSTRDFAVSVISGALPPGTSVGSADGVVFVRNWALDQVGNWPGVVIQVSDGYSTAQFSPFSVDVAGSPLTGCSASMTTAEIGRDNGVDGAYPIVYFGGGTPPFQVSAANVPAELGLTLTPPLLYQGQWIFAVHINPTGVVSTQNAAFVINDAAGASVSCPFQASSRATTASNE